MNIPTPDSSTFSNKPQRRGLARVAAAAGYSWAGLRQAWQGEAAFREEAMLCAILLPAALWVGRNAIEILLLVMSCLIVLIVELVNSAVEAAIDRIGSEHHPLSGRAKDIGSAAVFIALCQAGLIWCVMLWQRLF